MSKQISIDIDAAQEPGDLVKWILDAAQKEPVTITRHGRPVAVVVSAERHAELEALEDSMWAVRAGMASEKGLIGDEETREFIERMLNADS